MPCVVPDNHAAILNPSVGNHAAVSSADADVDRGSRVPAAAQKSRERNGPNEAVRTQWTVRRRAIDGFGQIKHLLAGPFVLSLDRYRGAARRHKLSTTPDPYIDLSSDKSDLRS
jgi:hypothetical protein